MYYSEIPWKLLILEGVVFIALGVLAIVHPFVMAISLEILLGSLLLVGGTIQGIGSLVHLKDPRSIPVLIGSVLAVIAGIILFAYPLTGVLTLTLLLTVYFFADGIMRIINGWQYRPSKGWGWLVFSGVISVVLAILILCGLPTTAIWVIGIYLGIYLLLLGFSFVTLGFFLRKGVQPQR